MNKGFALYQITNAYKKALDEFVKDEGDEVSLDEIKDTFDNKIINTVKYLKNVEAELSCVGAEVQRMRKRQEQLVKEIERLEGYIKQNMEETGLLDPIKCPEFTVKLQANPPAIEILNESHIPAIYKVVKEVVSWDKKLMKEDIQEGFEINGVRLIVRKRIVIK